MGMKLALTPGGAIHIVFKNKVVRRVYVYINVEEVTEGREN
jgi:hypothetical protein